MSLLSALTDRFATPVLAETFRCCRQEIAQVRTNGYCDVRMDQGAACDRGHRVDGGHALSAAVVCLSLRCRDRIEAVGNLQGDGASPAEGDHQPGNDGDVAGRTLPRLGWSVVFRGLVAGKIAAGDCNVGIARISRPLREGFRRRPKSAKPEILSDYQ